MEFHTKAILDLDVSVTFILLFLNATCDCHLISSMVLDIPYLPNSLEKCDQCRSFFLNQSSTKFSYSVPSILSHLIIKIYILH